MRILLTLSSPRKHDRKRRMYIRVLISLWLFLFHLQVVCSTSERIFLGWVIVLEQQSHKYVELRREHIF
jgi:hypothetical protein